METTVAAASGLPQEKKLYLLWMTVLVAIRHKSPDFFDALDSYNDNPMHPSVFKKHWDNVADRDNQREFITHGYLPNDRGQKSHITLGQVAEAYYQHSFTDMKEDRGDKNAYPLSVQEEVCRNDMPNTYSSSTVYPPSTAKYFDLVRTAGHLVSG